MIRDAPCAPWSAQQRLLLARSCCRRQAMPSEWFGDVDGCQYVVYMRLNAAGLCRLRKQQRASSFHRHNTNGANFCVVRVTCTR